MRHAVEVVASYAAAFFGLIATLPLMKIGGAVLLTARLIVDVPPAYNKLKEYMAGL